MTRSLSVAAESWPIRGTFRIARGAKRNADVVVATIADGPSIGRGECVPYPRYGESIASVVRTIEGLGEAVAAGLTRDALRQVLPAGAARNALDCALLDLEAKTSGRPVHALLGLPAPKPVTTAYTLSLDTPDDMAAAAVKAAANGYRLLKLKIAGAGDIERVGAVRRAVPDARLVVDANEAWSLEDLHRMAPALAQLDVALIEQPLKADADAALEGFGSPVPLCADESCHTRADLPAIRRRYSYINVKLDKAGGLTEALALCRAAQEAGLKLMIGCMVATSLAMAPALLLAQFADVIDLDGPLLLAADRTPSLVYRADVIEPAPSQLWG